MENNKSSSNLKPELLFAAEGSGRANVNGSTDVALSSNSHTSTVRASHALNGSTLSTAMEIDDNGPVLTNMLPSTSHSDTDHNASTSAQSQTQSTIPVSFPAVSELSLGSFRNAPGSEAVVNGNAGDSSHQSGPSTSTVIINSVPPLPSAMPVFPVPDPPKTFEDTLKKDFTVIPDVFPPLSTYPPSNLTGLVYDTRMMMHAPLGWKPTNGDSDSDDELDEETGLPKMSTSHPEEPRRIQRIYEKLREAGLTDDKTRVRKLPCPEAKKEEISLVHSEEVWDLTESTKDMSDEVIKRDWHLYEHHSLYVNRQTALAARLSCGGVISAAKAVMTGKVKNAIAVVRPPGHHAEPGASMGFCMYNNVAVATRVVMQELGVKKVLILDWDVHHGNGTQRAFEDDPNVLYMSIHRHDGGRFYPASDYGAMDVTGSGPGIGKSVNIPWPRGGFGDAEYIYAFQKIVMPIAYEFAPELVIISAGFDAAKGDQLGGCEVTPAGYAHMTYILSSLAGGKVVVALEGGYNLSAISDSAEAVARVLVGEPLPELAPMAASDMACEIMYQVAKVQSKYWKSIDVKACEPLDEALESTPDTVFQIPEIIKAHRAKLLYDKYGMFSVPMGNPGLDEAFPQQVMTDGKIYDSKTIVVFVHDFGNLQVEAKSVMYVDVDEEKARLIDSSNNIVRWAKEHDFGVLDVNVMKQLQTHQSQLPSGQPLITKTGPKLYQLLMRHLWDNLIELSRVENVILFGYGTGCQAIMSLVNDRDVEPLVTAVIQVGGINTLVRPDPYDDDKRAWMRKHSKLYVSSDHRILEDPIYRKRLSTDIIAIPKSNSLSVLRHALPEIEDYVVEALRKREETLEKGVDMNRSARWYLDSIEVPGRGVVSTGKVNEDSKRA